MHDDLHEVAGSGLLATLEKLAKTYIIAAVLWWLFLILSWPFVACARLVLFLITLGRVRLNHRQAMEHQGIQTVAFFLLFLPVLFYVHIVYGAHWYGNKS